MWATGSLPQPHVKLRSHTTQLHIQYTFLQSVCCILMTMTDNDPFYIVLRRLWMVNLLIFSVPIKYFTDKNATFVSPNFLKLGNHQSSLSPCKVVEVKLVTGGPKLCCIGFSGCVASLSSCNIDTLANFNTFYVFKDVVLYSSKPTWHNTSKL